MVKVFISHSGGDVELAELLVVLLRSSLNLSADEIRCTSVDGYCLPAGAAVNEQLREELLTAPVFIGLLSKASFQSAYVLFELGARWGAKKHLIPLLAPGADANILKGPIAGLNALSCDSDAQLFQLVDEVATALAAECESPAVYLKDIDRILSLQVSTVAVDPRSRPHMPTAQGDHPGVDDYENAEEVIKTHCEDQWKDDFRMRAYCERQQRQALNELRQGRPEDIPEDVFRRIRAQCAAEWTEDFRMRRYCEKQQMDSFRELHRGN